MEGLIGARDGDTTGKQHLGIVLGKFVDDLDALHICLQATGKNEDGAPSR